ncbi:MAG TPA: hypothetical protein PLW10_25220 [Myxococcota bacterium]|nr:hypothetical protein [Myxococcota bacterium]
MLGVVVGALLGRARGFPTNDAIQTLGIWLGAAATFGAVWVALLPIRRDHQLREQRRDAIRIVLRSEVSRGRSTVFNRMRGHRGDDPAPLVDLLQILWSEVMTLSPAEIKTLTTAATLTRALWNAGPSAEPAILDYLELAERALDGELGEDVESIYRAMVDSFRLERDQ